MELRNEIDELGMFIPMIMKIVGKIDLRHKEFEFLYGSDEYNTDLKKTMKQFKRLWLKKK